MTDTTLPRVLAVSTSPTHDFSKQPQDVVTLVAGLGVAGDTHSGTTVQHRSRVRRDPTTPNLRQVHLIHAELFDELRDVGFEVRPGDLGENVTTRGVDLLGLPRGTRLQLGTDAEVEITGLRNPCQQINDFRPGLLREVVGTDDAGEVVRKAGVMAVVHVGGDVAPGDTVTVTLPDGPHERLAPV
ncbi:MOSC domain-containing protein [Luteimicrobium subarcticum]|uniref:MOSC domain-containing protein YiiM n=1 Tax=Luteimicrobium subarcticum TaxID=620910 RepID=A0A2M8WQV9_9MICO|nr:MOSC domain-containing protein [Luteimicrobium subarcticum]PJI93320.1 MOSC domain-containing protein YiiM [Luteimicrobium subarcticum]